MKKNAAALIILLREGNGAESWEDFISFQRKFRNRK